MTIRHQPGNHAAEANYRRIHQWQEASYHPACNALWQDIENARLDRARTAANLRFAREWLAVARAAEGDAGAAQLVDFIHDTLPLPFGRFWGLHYRAHEACRPARVEDSPFFLGAYGDAPVLARVRDWFAARGLSFARLCAMFDTQSSGDVQRRYRAYLGDDDLDSRRFWQIFLAGLARSLSCPQSLVSLEFRSLPEWQARFPVLALDLNGDITMLDYFQDPITLGGAFALLTVSPMTSGSRTEREQYLMFSMFTIIDYVLDTLGMADSCAEQAICVFIDMHQLQW
ncbi:hypothetical protein HDZ31DRAFT_33252 [Schizophyllum fasciatum]